jgi:hypothetical protein
MLNPKQLWDALHMVQDYSVLYDLKDRYLDLGDFSDAFLYEKKISGRT